MTLRNRNVEDRAVQQNFEALDATQNALAARVTTVEGKVWIPTVVALPGAPVNGQEVYYVADATNGVVWHLKYRSASASVYKWEFVGGAALYSEVPANQAVTSAVYTNLATIGPLLTLPLAGDYEVEIGASLSSTGNGQPAYMSYEVGGSAAVDADSINGYVFQSSGTRPDAVANGSRPRRKTVIAPMTLTAKYRTPAGSLNAESRWMRATPLRVGP